MWEFNPRALKYLNEVARLGSLRKVAAYLNIDASAISRQLAQLEEDVGAAVGMRSGRGFILTQIGEELVTLFRQQKASEAAALSRIEALHSLKRGRVSIAVGEGFIADLISEPLQAFMSRYPNIQISIEMAGANEATRLVKDDRVDLALVYAPSPDTDLHSHVITRQPLDLITPPQHPLIKISSVTLEKISNYPLALIDQQFGMGQLVSLVEELEHVRLVPQLRTNSVAALKNFVLSGMGVTFMPKLTVHSEIQQGKIACISLSHPVFASASAQIVSHKGRELTVSAETLLKYLSDGMLFFNEV